MEIIRTHTATGRYQPKRINEVERHTSYRQATDGSWYSIHAYTTKGESVAVTLDREEMRRIAEAYNATATED